MSMTAITAFQFLGILCAYLVITFFGPHFVLGKTVHYRNRYERFMMYTMIGNFYAVNLVYLLELCHIASRFTLILFTVVPCVLLKIKFENIPIKEKLLERLEFTRRIFGGQQTVKNYRVLRRPVWKRKSALRRKKFAEVYLTNLPEVILIILLILAVFWIYGQNFFKEFGYQASDAYVHNYWINEMSENRIFVGGVYPFGFHCLAFYMHSVFGIDTYVLMRLLGLIGTIWLHLMLFCFVRLLVKSKYISYIGVFVYILGNFFSYNSYFRFVMSLPQEYGIIFILPTVYCGFMFFKEQKLQLHGSYSGKVSRYLAGFAISFSLTLTTHFYGIMVVGIMCLSMAIGYAKLFFSKPYFRRVILTVVVAVIIAILPMGIAVAMGTNLQGSLRWGLNVISASKNQDTYYDSDGIPIEIEEDNVIKPAYVSMELVEKYGVFNGTLVGTYQAVRNSIYWYVFPVDGNQEINLLLILIPVILLEGILVLLFRRLDHWYGSLLVTLSLSMLFLLIMLSANSLMIPALMDANRSRIYFAYILAAVVPFFIDSILYLLFSKARGSKWIYSIVSIALLLFVLFRMYSQGHIREPLDRAGAEYNSAVECLTKIISENDDFTWTICSANDEGKMVYDHGYHFEAIEFLRTMEKDSLKDWLRIPTPKVYLFIEKKPQEWYSTWSEGAGTSISTEKAYEPLPEGYSISVYKGESRWIVMSRMYEWIKTFENMYPNEVTVFYEDDDFVCYCIEQNPYRLFNLSIDYGCNTEEIVSDNVGSGE